MGRRKKNSNKQQATSNKTRTTSVPNPSRTTNYILRTTTTPTKLELSLFSIIVFLIPTNLFLTFFTDSAFVHGIRIDYLIPKLYLSDIFIALLLIAWLARPSFWQFRQRRHRDEPRKSGGFTRLVVRPQKPGQNTPLFTYRLSLIATLLTLPKPKRTQPYLVTLFHHPSFTIYTLCFMLLSLTLSSWLSSNPISSYWFLLKIFEFSLLTLWIATSLRSPLLIKKPLLYALLFQSLVAILQWIQQKSLLGYLFLGETTLRANSHVAKTSLGGQIRPLPYGTTAHPNILAGFIAITLLTLLINHKLNLKQLVANKLLTFTLTLALTSLLLTQSLSALLALIVGALLLHLHRHPKSAQRYTLNAIRYTLPLVLPLVIGYWLLVIKPQSLPDSVTRRTQLIDIGLNSLLHHPLLGVGPNNFITQMTKFGTIPGNIRFLQPIHNIYLLFIAETGLITLTLTLTLTYKLLVSFDKRKNLSIPLTLPFLALLLIGTLDHYPYTLQSGQLMLSLTTGLALSSLNPHNRANFQIINR